MNLFSPAQERFLEMYRVAGDRNRFSTSSRYVVEEFEAELIGTTRKMIVSRTYYPTHAPSVKYRDCFIVGPKGAIRKTVYDRIGH